MSIEGKLHIRLDRDSSVDIRSTRPLGVTRLLVGLTPDQALETIPRLFQLCGYAQSFAALDALCQARQIEPHSQTLAAQRLLVDAESIREHGLRIAMDWARFLGESPTPAAKHLARFPARVQSALFGTDPALLESSRTQPDGHDLREVVSQLSQTVRDHILGMTAEEWLGCYGSDRSLWLNNQATLAARYLHHVNQQNAADLGISEVRTLDALTDASLKQRFASPEAEEFIARPTWEGEPRENSPWPRRGAGHAPGLLERLWGRLDHLARLVTALQDYDHLEISDSAKTTKAPPDQSGTGIGSAESARGRLYHHIVLERGQIVSYHILAPTEWNFHPQGVVASGLKTLNWDDRNQVRQQATWFINAVDPCVEFALELT